MRVLVLGGYGFIGLAIAQRLHAAGHAVIGLGRSIETGRRLFPTIRWISVDIAAMQTPEHWQPYLEKIDVVINAAGALQDSPRENLARVHGTSIIALVKACEGSKDLRFIQISAPGATTTATTEFMRSKARADAAIKKSTIDWVILRPGLVIGPNAYGGSALIRLLAAFPVVLLIAFPNQRIQTVALSDVTRIVLLAALGRLPRRLDVDLLEVEPHSLRNIVERFRAWLGVPPARAVIAVPDWAVGVAAWIAHLLGYLGWRSPMRSTAMRAIKDEVLGDPSAIRAIDGSDLLSLDKTLEAMPATIQDRWFARLYLSMPAMVAVLSAFWLLSGIVAMLDVSGASAVIPEGKFPERMAPVLVVGGAIFDILLGAAILYRPLARHACLGMAFVSLLYVVSGTILSPELWLDPLGPLIKVFPEIVLALATWSVLEER